MYFLGGLEVVTTVTFFQDGEGYTFFALILRVGGRAMWTTDAI